MPDSAGIRRPFARHVAERPDAVAVRTVTESRTFAELDAQAARVANWLAERGIGPGARVGVVSRNRIELLDLMVGCVRAGVTFVPLNWRFTAPELADAVAVSRLSLLVADLSVLPPPPHGVPVVDVAGVGELIAACSPEFPASEVGEAPLWHLFTSGTAARPKAAMTTPGNLACHIDGWARAWGVGTESVLWNPYPSYHNNFTGVSTTILAAGGRVELRDSVTMDDLVWSIEERRVSHAVMVPVVLREFLDRPDLADRDLSSLRRIICGTAPTSPALLRRFARLAPGCVLANSYGMTESTTPITHIDYTVEDFDDPRRITSVGRALPWVELQLRDPVTTERVPTGAVGEVWIRSAATVRAYWQRPEETARTMRADGWLRTADLGRLDADGYLFLTDRLGDLIISGGENVSPAEVESVLSRFPGVREVAVVGAPHERWGEAPVAFVVAEPGRTVAPQELLRFAREELAGFKVPVEVRVTDALPRNTNGKILRRALRRCVR